jgi:hypothetical protein
VEQQPDEPPLRCALARIEVSSIKGTSMLRRGTVKSLRVAPNDDPSLVRL